MNTTTGPIVRHFEAHAKPGCGAILAEKFRITSASVVADEPGNIGYYFGHEVGGDADVLIFASVWENLAAVKQRFGDTWQQSFLPEGYEDLIERCFVRHFDMNGGWQV